MVEPNQKLLAAAVCMGNLVLSACQNDPEVSSWPPFAGSAVQSFTHYREDVEALRDLMKEVPYSSVSRIGDDEVYGYREVDGEIADEVPTNPRLWVDLMERSEINSVIRGNDKYFFNTISQESPTNRIETIQYIYSDDLPAKRCVETFSDVSCGICDVSRHDQWTIRFMWSSGEYIEDYLQSSLEGTIAKLESDQGQDKDFQLDRDAFRNFNETNLECLRNGLEKMGYENPTDYF